MKTMGGRSAAAFTLIELLIVVAIIAIMSAASMAVIVAPMQERTFASLDHSRQAGESTLLARLVEDTHSAARIPTAEAGRLVLETTGSAALRITYHVDTDHHLRRHVAKLSEPAAADGTGAALIDDVLSFTPELVSDGRQCRVQIASGVVKYNRPVGSRQDVVLAVGSAGWSGEVRP
jgi:prepilin-type N-terminal cleavage/methylation domain-containing protein